MAVEACDRKERPSSMAAKKELGTSDLLVPDSFLLLKLLEPPLKKKKAPFGDQALSI